MTTWVSRHQKGKPFWILLEQEMMGWQWQQPDHMQIIGTSLQTDNHASTSPLRFYRPDTLPVAQATMSKHWRQNLLLYYLGKYLSYFSAELPSFFVLPIVHFWSVLVSHLDPFGCVASFLDAAFRNVFNNGVVVATCTDVAALYGTCPAPALRNYGARVARTDFVKEMAARVVVSAMARFVVTSVSCLA